MTRPFPALRSALIRGKRLSSLLPSALLGARCRADRSAPDGARFRAAHALSNWGHSWAHSGTPTWALSGAVLVGLFGIVGGCSSDSERPKGPTPGVRILVPNAGDTVSGSVPVELALVLNQELKEMRFGLDVDNAGPGQLVDTLTADCAQYVLDSDGWSVDSWWTIRVFRDAMARRRRKPAEVVHGHGPRFDGHFERQLHVLEIDQVRAAGSEKRFGGRAGPEERLGLRCGSSGVRTGGVLARLEVKNFRMLRASSVALAHFVVLVGKTQPGGAP